MTEGALSWLVSDQRFTVPGRISRRNVFARIYADNRHHPSSTHSITDISQTRLKSSSAQLSPEGRLAAVGQDISHLIKKISR